MIMSAVLLVFMFQSTRPGRSATCCKCNPVTVKAVSIHAPRAERDRCSISDFWSASSFNPRAPGGARLRKGAEMGRADDVSIHAPRAERDGFGKCRNPPRFVFQSTRPGRSATCRSG